VTAISTLNVCLGALLKMLFLVGIRESTFTLRTLKLKIVEMSLELRMGFVIVHINWLRVSTHHAFVNPTISSEFVNAPLACELATAVSRHPRYLD